MAEFVMPALGADMEAGTLIAWLKNPGDKVVRGEVIAEIDTDKGVIEVECFTTGIVEQLLTKPGDKVPVGTVLAIIREEGEAAMPSLEAPIEERVIREMTRIADAPPIERLKISPLARKTAESLGIDPKTILGTGPGGRITQEDVEKAAASKPSGDGKKGERIRQAIAVAMEKSKREIPHYYLGTTIDMTNCMKWLAAENLNRSAEGRLLYGVLLIKAVALALRQFPELNGFWQDGKAVQSPEINVGLAISLRGGGLVSPAIHDADRKSLDELMEAFRDLVQRSRSGRLRSSELSDPTITITSLGEQGVETVFGIIYPPQVALVGFGKVVERPWAVNGLLGVHQVMNASLSADHRVSDGHRGGLFLALIERLLQEPEDLRKVESKK